VDSDNSVSANSQNRTHVHVKFFAHWRVLSPPKVLTFRPASPYILTITNPSTVRISEITDDRFNVDKSVLDHSSRKKLIIMILLLLIRIWLYVRVEQIPGARSPGRLHFYTVAPNIRIFSVWNLCNVTLLAPGILRWLLCFWKICALLLYVFMTV
jgi:hypothetical protein